MDYGDPAGPSTKRRRIRAYEGILIWRLCGAHVGDLASGHELSEEVFDMQNSNAHLPACRRLGHAAGLGLVFALAACASGANAESISAAEQAQVQDICHTVMHFNPGDMHFEACVESLGHTVSGIRVGIRDAKRHQDHRQACGAKGLRPGTRDFAVCVAEGA
ncbi:MAG: hypothetical protein ACYCZX_16720 [Rhodospirillaceae bacterium]